MLMIHNYILFKLFNFIMTIRTSYNKIFYFYSKFFIHLFLLTLCLSVFSFSFAQDDSTRNSKDALAQKDFTLDTLLDSDNERSFIGEYSDYYFNIKQLNEGLPNSKGFLNLQTPQATMEHFINSCAKKNFQQAAYALNFNLLPQKIDSERAAILAKKLFYVMDKRVSLNWDDLPDRPDGQINQATAGSKSIAGKAQKSICFGSLSLDGRTVPLQIDRVKVEKEAPLWVISANTVENIELIYKECGPSKLDRLVPEWGEFKFFGVQVWKLIGLLIFAFACYYLGKLIAYIINKLVNRL